MRTKTKNRLVYRGILFCAVFGYTIFFSVNSVTSGLTSTTNVKSPNRKLLSCDGVNDTLYKEMNGPGRIPEAFTYTQVYNGAFVFYFFGMVYMFLALSIVCDECFCPALDVAVEVLQISPDVAGATLMAAGGSAPELATSFVGTFYNSDVGFGTIVGSAVFNVLFVIGTCVYCSSEVLRLTWWPLFRDCSVYAFGLGLLALFFVGSWSKNQIEWWESLTLLLMYVGYVVLMSKNQRLERWIKSKLPKKTERSDEQKSLRDEEGSENNLLVIPERKLGHRHTVLQLAKGDPLIRDAEEQVIRRMRGSMDETFRQLDRDGDGYIDHDEFKTMVKESELNADDLEIQQLIKKLDLDDDGKITKEEFQKWYVESEKRVWKEASNGYHKFAKDSGNGTPMLKKKHIKKVLTYIDKKPYKSSDTIVTDAIESLKDSSDSKYVTKKEFDDWYQNSELVAQTLDALQKAGEAEIDDEGGLSLEWPDNCRARIMHIISFPLVLPLYFTVPNVRVDKWRNWWPFSFFMAILWVAVFSIAMVQWATVFGLAIRIPTKVMGLIFLAAGTSIPDLLTSVSVAMAGKGDMAVSSSIGSNIFDILVGLPLPWLVRSFTINFKPIQVGSPDDNVGLSVLILMGVVILVIVTVAAVGWKMDKRLAIVFFIFYFLYVGQELLLYYTVGPGKNPQC